MEIILIILITFHIVGAVLYCICWWERNWWRNEAEALQLVHFRTKERLQQMIHEVEDTREEMECWERKAADLWAGMAEEVEA
jgi:hypothetical protein